MCRITSTIEHYDMLIDEGCDPFRDDKLLKLYMSRWDGPLFYKSLNLTRDKTVLEVGVGTGRVAQNILDMGCRLLVGLDVSPKTIARAEENLLSKYNNVELVLQSIEEYKRGNFFDVAFSVLTFMHIEYKEYALANMIASLKPGGDIVLSISEETEWLDYGSRKVKLYPEKPDYYLEILEKMGCKLDEPIDLIDTFILPNGQKQAEYGQRIATIVKGTKK